MSLFTCDPREVLEQYEALRREALEAPAVGARGHGLALFLSRGMAHWLGALSALAPSPIPPPASAPRPAERGLRVLPAARAELTTVLAGMVLACTHQREVQGCTARAR